MKSKKTKLPKLNSDNAAEKFIESSDLTRFDLSSMRPVRFELKRKNKTISLRLPEDLLLAAQKQADHMGIPYQRFMRAAIESALEKNFQR